MGPGSHDDLRAKPERGQAGWRIGQATFLRFRPQSSNHVFPSTFGMSPCLQPAGILLDAWAAVRVRVFSNLFAAERQTPRRKKCGRAEILFDSVTWRLYNTVMNGPRWTIDELGAATARALAVDYHGPPNHRVRDVPDRRTIRYYTTLGLIDRPAAMRGRTALYGRKHLLQLVAIKRLQAEGLSLADVQRRLLGLSDAALARLARVPAESELPAAAPPARPRATIDRPARVASFWKTAPAAVPMPSPPEPVSLQGVRLADQLTLLLAATRPLSHDDLEALHRAAQPVIELLQSRRLIGPREEGELP